MEIIEIVQIYGICEHCCKYTVVRFEVNENGEPVTTPLCQQCEDM